MGATPPEELADAALALVAAVEEAAVEGAALEGVAVEGAAVEGELDSVDSTLVATGVVVGTEPLPLVSVANRALPSWRSPNASVIVGFA